MILSVSENLQMAWHGISANKVRSGLTTLSVMIGVATVITLLSIGQGVRESITGSIASAGTNLVFVVPGALAGRGGVQGAGAAASLTLADALALADPQRVPDALVVAPEYTQRAQLIVGDRNTNVPVKGVTEQYPNAVELSLASGRFVDEKDVRAQSNVVVLGSQVAADLFGGFDPLGQQVRAAAPGGANRLVPLTVVGVLAPHGRAAVSGDMDNTVLAPLSTVANKIGNGRNVLGQPVVSVVNVVAAPNRSPAVSADIDGVLRRRHKLTDEEEADFSVISQEDLLSLVGTVTGLLTLFLGFIAVISLVVGGIGIMNIMLVSVTERTREIGIRKAVGARRSDILTQFLLEAVMLSVLGGLMGLALGGSVAYLVNLSGRLTTSVSPASVALALGFSLAVGLISGVYPASRAASLNPIEALHFE
jgi:putative ABC transport system permease protein